MTARRDTWVERSWKRDVAAVTRWLCMTARFEADGQSIVLLRCVLGWDNSPSPQWMSPFNCERLVAKIDELPSGGFEALLDEQTRRDLDASTEEIRRLELPVTDWLGAISSGSWNLRVPIIVYEIWASNSQFDAARKCLDQLTDTERAALAVLSQTPSHCGSTVILVPQRRPYLLDIHNLVMPGGTSEQEELHLISEVMDGPIVLARNTGLLRPEPIRELKPEESRDYLKLHYPPANFAAMQDFDHSMDERALARYPEDAHGHSGSDWRISVMGPKTGCTVATVGLIRRVGSFRRTTEPWRDRAPMLGFSAPARVQHVPPSAQGANDAFGELGRAGKPIMICDPFAETQSLSRLQAILAGGRILTRHDQLHRLDATWAKRMGVDVRTADQFHDRFVTGADHGWLIGTSLNGLGRKHSFLTHLDNVMRQQVVTVFEGLWSTATPAFQESPVLSNHTARWKQIVARVASSRVESRSCPDQHVGLVSQVAGHQEDDFPQRLSANDRPEDQAAIILILESPHIEEFTRDPGPAKGRTGKNIRAHLREVLRAVIPSEHLDRHALILMNAIQYQCSLGVPPRLYRDEMFKETWDKFGRADFAQRLRAICRADDFLLNACTKGKMRGHATELRDMVEEVVQKVCPAARIRRVYHPVSWHWPRRRGGRPAP